MRGGGGEIQSEGPKIMQLIELTSIRWEKSLVIISGGMSPKKNHRGYPNHQGLTAIVRVDWLHMGEVMGKYYWFFESEMMCFMFCLLNIF